MRVFLGFSVRKWFNTGTVSYDDYNYSQGEKLETFFPIFYLCVFYFLLEVLVKLFLAFYMCVLGTGAQKPFETFQNIFPSLYDNANGAIEGLWKNLEISKHFDAFDWSTPKSLETF